MADLNAEIERAEARLDKALAAEDFTLAKLIQQDINLKEQQRLLAAQAQAAAAPAAPQAGKEDFYLYLT